MNVKERRYIMLVLMVIIRDTHQENNNSLLKILRDRLERNRRRQNAVFSLICDPCKKICKQLYFYFQVEEEERAFCTNIRSSSASKSQIAALLNFPYSIQNPISSPSLSIYAQQIRSTPPKKTNSGFFITKSRNKPNPFLCGNSSNTSASTNGTNSSSGRSFLEAVGERISTAFPLWVALGCLMGLVKPSSFNWVQPKWTITGITITMLGIGMTLTLDDLRSALAMPKELLASFLLQYSTFTTKNKKGKESS